MEQRRCLCRAYRRAIGLGQSFAAGLAAGLPERAYAHAYLGSLTGEAGEEEEARDFPGLTAEAAARIRGHLRGLMDQADEEFLRRHPSAGGTPGGQKSGPGPGPTGDPRGCAERKGDHAGDGIPRPNPCPHPSNARAIVPVLHRGPARSPDPPRMGCSSSPASPPWSAAAAARTRCPQHGACAPPTKKHSGQRRGPGPAPPASRQRGRRAWRAWRARSSRQPAHTGQRPV